jgi:hypothetical protein
LIATPQVTPLLCLTHPQAAKAKWEQIIKVDVPDFVNTRNLDLSLGDIPNYTNTQRNIDDIVIM